MADPASRPPRRPSKAFSRMFSAFFLGACLVVTGLIGWDVRHMSGLFRGARWVDAPVWWQLLGGIGLLLLAVHWARRLGAAGWTFVRTPHRRTIKYVGRGTTAGVEKTQERRLASGEPRPSRDA